MAPGRWAGGPVGSCVCGSNLLYSGAVVNQHTCDCTFAFLRSGANKGIGGLTLANFLGKEVTDGLSG